MSHPFPLSTQASFPLYFHITHSCWRITCLRGIRQRPNCSLSLKCISTLPLPIIPLVSPDTGWWFRWISKQFNSWAFVLVGHTQHSPIMERVENCSASGIKGIAFRLRFIGDKWDSPSCSLKLSRRGTVGLSVGGGRKTLCWSDANRDMVCPVSLSDVLSSVVVV